MKSNRADESIYIPVNLPVSSIDYREVITLNRSRYANVSHQLRFCFPICALATHKARTHAARKLAPLLTPNTSIYEEETEE